MKIFLLVKTVFFIGLTILTGSASVNSFSCLSMNNQECKTRTQVVNVNGDELVEMSLHLVLKQVNVVVVVII